MRTRFEHPFSLVDQFLFQLQVGAESHFVPRRLGRARGFCREVQQVALRRTTGKNECEFWHEKILCPYMVINSEDQERGFHFLLALLTIILNI